MVSNMDLNWIIQTIILIGIGAIGFFLKSTITELKNKDQEHDAKIVVVENKLENKINELGKELNDLKSDMPLLYVNDLTWRKFIKNILYNRKLLPDHIFDHSAIKTCWNELCGGKLIRYPDIEKLIVLGSMSQYA